MTTITGALVQTEFNTSTAVATLEVIIDSVIDTVNSDAGTSIGYMTGASPNKTITVTGDQAAAIKAMLAMKLASYATSGAQSASTGFNMQGIGISTSSSASSSQSADVNQAAYQRAITRLRSAPIFVSNDPVPTET